MTVHRRVSGWRTSILGGLAAACLAAPALAQDPVPERRLIGEAGTDFYGDDIRSVFGTTLELCRDICLAEADCAAMTFNTASSACFVKRGVAERQPHPNALSATVVPTAPELLARAAARAAELDFLPTETLALGRAAALDGLAHPSGGLDAQALADLARTRAAAGDAGGAAETLQAAAILADTADAWLAAAAAAAAVETDDWDRRQAMRQLAVAAAINGYLRAPETAAQARAARALGGALEAWDEGRLALSALRLSARLAPGGAIAAEVARAEGLYGFRVVDRQVDFESALPRACFTFSEPLRAAGVDYADYVRVEGGALPVEADESQLCVDGLAHGARYAVTLRAGLPAASGEVLSRPVAQEVYVRDRSPAVRFLGRAYVLPKSPDAAIPLSSVNTDAVALRIHRVGERSVAAVLRSGDFGAALSPYDETTLAAELGRTVWEGTAEIVPELNRDVVTALPVGEAIAGLDPGLYAITARIPEAPEADSLATQWFVVTDLGLATLKGTDGLHVFLRSLASAEPREGVAVQLLARDNGILGTTTTDAAGRARFDPGLLRGTGGAEPALLTAEADGDFAFLSLTDPAFDLSDRGVEGRPAPPPVDVFLSTERGAYRPGETVFATVLARDADVAAVEGLPLTAIVTRPDGVENSRIVLPDQGAGGRALTLPLDPDAQRGGWRLAIHADPEAPPLATTSFLVEDFVPERIALTLSLPEGPIDPAAPPPLAVQAAYLWGAPAADLALEGETTVALERELPGFPGYRFGLEDEPFGAGFEALPAGLSTDAAGDAEVPLPVATLGPVSRPLTLTATLRATDGSGRPVERSVTRPLLPAEPLIGVRPLFDGAVDEGATASFEIVALGPDFARTALDPVEWTLSRVETSYQWYETGGAWNWEPITRRERVDGGRLALGPDAPARLDLPVQWGHYELALATTDGRYIATSLGFDAGWAESGPGAETPDRLDLSLDREAYAVGDTARVRIDAPNAGRALVAVMSDRLVATEDVAVVEGETIVDLPVTADWGPGAYVTATLVRPMDIAARRNPARAIGLAWASVDPGARRLAASFEPRAEARPREPLEAVLRVEGVDPAEAVHATIAAVDVGILNLTGFEAPDPDGHYFGQRRLGVEIRDVYGRLIDGMQGTPGRIRSGGDAGGGFRSPPPTEPLVAFFSGPLTVGADGLVRTEFPLPDFNGTVRLMAVVWSATGVGQASTDVLVRAPVVVQANLPRFLAPGDTATLVLDLAHASGPEGPVTVRVSADDPALLPDGPATLSGELTAGGRLALAVPLAAGTPGDRHLTIETLAPGGETLVKSLALGVRANDPVIARQSRVALAPGATLTLDAAVFDGLAPGTAQATLAAGPLADFDVPGLLTALDAYPFGCTEQLVSQAMPLLYFAEVARGLDLARTRDVDARIAQAIRGVLANQAGSGGFGLWSPEAGDGWLDGYVTDFLARARDLGHEVPDRAFEAALVNLQNLVNAYGDFEHGGEDLAYALMVLAREGRASIGDLRYYADARAEAFATPFAQAQLGLALAWYGDQPRADAMFRLASAGAEAGEPEQLFRADYGSGLRDAAGVLALGAEAGSQAIDRTALAERVTAPGPTRSTQESLWTLLAAHALLAEAPAGGITLEGQPAEGPVTRLLDPAALAAAPLAVRNDGAAETTVVVTAFGVPIQPEPAGGNGYRIERALFTLDGAPADPGAIPLNERLVAVLTVTPERDLEARLIVTDPLPAGLEIDNPNLLRAGQTGQLAWLAADEVARDTEFGADRFVAAVDWQGTAPFRLAYMVRAVLPGRFHRPAASVEDMYRPAYRARTDAGRVEVAPGP
jgi:uncharacterized protein YfaS (alpha-2-macroglobulin family)